MDEHNNIQEQEGTVMPPQGGWFTAGQDFVEPLQVEVPEEALTSQTVEAAVSEAPQPQPVYIPAEPASQPVYAPAEPSPQWDYAPAAHAPVSVPVTKPKKGRGLRTALALVLVLALVVCSSFATAMILEKRFEERMAARDEENLERLEQLEQRMEEEEGKGSISINTVTSSPTQGNTADSGNTDGILTPAQVYEKNLDSVLMIYNEMSSGYFGTVSTSTGTGFVISEDGYVVTNYHVVEGDGTLSVVTASGQEYPAKLVGYNIANDVAVLKVDGQKLQPVLLGDSDSMIVGDQVAAIGNPLGELTSTLTVGYVSAKGRAVNTSGFAINMIQTDAAINSGNSGGPLFNMRGEVIGITTAKYSGSSSSGASIEGIGFAIPINDVLAFLEDMIVYGYETGPYLGVSVSDMDAVNAEYYGVPVGAYVSAVVEDSCAEKAGVQVEDIIVKLGDYKVGSVNELTRALRNYDPGDTIEVVVFRVDEELTLTITLDAKPVETEAAESTESEGKRPGRD